jgi:putative transposase
MQRCLRGFVKRRLKAIGSKCIEWLRVWTKPDHHGLVGGADIDILKTPVEAPRANAFCERFLGSLRRECLDYMLVLSERHLRQIVSEYVTYFNQARPHQGIDQRIPCDPPLPDQPEGEMVGIPVLGGLHHDYRWKAA